MSSMRTLVAITSLCSLSLFSSCVGLDKPVPLQNPDSGRDGQPVDFPAAQDGVSGLPDRSTDATSPSAGPDGALDGVAGENGAGDGLPLGLDGGDAGRDTPTGTDTATSPAPDAVDDATEDAQPDAGEADALVLSGTCAIADSPAPPGTVCRVSSGLCDVAEVCDGVSTACPLDRFRAAAEICRAKAGDCDVEETCSGTSAACPADKVLADGATCRAAVSDCDVPEYCDGASPACPVDAFAPVTTTPCRESTDHNICDPAEYCTGTSNSCPADAKYSPPAAAPTGVAVTPGTLQADVAWNPVTGATGYRVKSSAISGAGYAVRGTPTTSPFTVTPIPPGQLYYFVVSAFSSQPTCESADSSPPVSALSCVAAAPSAPIATSDTAGNVVLKWTPPVGTVSSYSVSRSTTSGSGYTILSSGILTATYTDKQVVPAGGTATLYYVVRANTGTCLSPYSTEATAAIGSARADAGADAGADARADAGADSAKDTTAD